MVFCSLEFLLWYLPVFFLLYGLIPDKYKNIVLLSGSLVFYALGDSRHLLLLGVSVIGNFYIGRYLGAKKKVKKKYRESYRRKKRNVLAAAVIGNVGVLFWCKAGLLGGELPLGISFYTFQILSYLIDVYRGRIRREDSLINLATYVVMFPKLISGPIAGYGEVADVIARPGMTGKDVQDGLKLFTVGLAAKVLLADRVGLLWNEVLVAGIENITTPLAWISAIAYSFKIYFDFYGYSLMAIGLGRMMGFALPANFDTPYMAVTVRDFYRRWHITLGRWFRDYVYIPLGGSRKGELRTVANLLAVWLLTALWHGMTGNFLMWGAMLFGLIVLERQAGKLLARWRIANAADAQEPDRWAWIRRVGRGFAGILGHLYLWAVIPVTWMCFAAADTEQMFVFLGRMFGLTPPSAVFANDWKRSLQDYGGLLLLSCVACTPLLQKAYRRWKDSLIVTVLLAAVFWLCVWRIRVEGNNPFLYFRF